MGAVSNAASRFDPTTTSGLAALSTGGLSLVAEDALQEGGFIEQNLLGGAQKDAAERAAQRQEAAALTAQELQQQTTEQIRGDLAPFREAGASTIPLLQGAIDDPSSRVLNNPFFQQIDQLFLHLPLAIVTALLDINLVYQYVLHHLML